MEEIDVGRAEAEGHLVICPHCVPLGPGPQIGQLDRRITERILQGMRKEQTMGSYHFSILASGPHDNGKPYDIEELAKGWIHELQVNGHVIERVDVTIGGRKNLLGPVAAAPLPPEVLAGLTNVT